MGSATSKSITKLYGGLGPKEIRRLMAKLSREQNPDEMNRMARAIPDEHARIYNDGLKLLRVLNGNLNDWIGLMHLGMQRDRFRFQHLYRESALTSSTQWQLLEMWRFIRYPITESELLAIRRYQRAEMLSLDGYAEMLSEYEGDEPGLHTAIAEYLRNLPPELERLYVDENTPERGTPEYEAFAQEDRRRYAVIAKGIRAIIDKAIKKGELPKPKKHEGELSLPYGVLSDWGEGTTEESFEIGGPGSNIPMLTMLQGQLATEWDIRPDSEADAVKEERDKMLRLLPMLPTIPQSVRDEIGSLEPPLSRKDFNRDEDRRIELYQKWYGEPFAPPLMLDAAQSHAGHRAQYEGLIEAQEILQREEFYGEDPLFPEIRAIIEEAQEEKEKFASLWESANKDWELRKAFYELQGLESPEINMFTNLEELQPAPMPMEEPTTEESLRLIRGWGS